MSYIPERDWDFEVRKGNVLKHEVVAIIGHSESIGTTKVTIQPDPSVEITQSDIDATPATVQVASTSANDVDTTGTGAWSVLVIGLDASGVEQSETVLLNGQTAVATVNTYSAITGLRVLTAGTTGSNEGNIWVGNGTFTAGVPATPYSVADIAYNKGLCAYYVVPATKTFYGTQFIANMSSSAKDVEFFIETSADGAFWVTEAVFGFSTGATIVSPIHAMPGMPPGTHIRIRAEANTATTDITALMDGYLVAA
jgi:hypothetical protein